MTEVLRADIGRFVSLVARVQPSAVGFRMLVDMIGTVFWDLADFSF